MKGEVETYLTSVSLETDSNVLNGVNETKELSNWVRNIQLSCWQGQGRTGKSS